MSDSELAAQPKQHTALAVAQKTDSVEHLDRLMRNPGISPRVLFWGCKNKTATLSTWHTAAENMLERMKRTPIQPEGPGRNDDEAIAEAAAYMLNRAKAAPTETMQLLESVWDEAIKRGDMRERQLEEMYRQKSWEESSS